MSSNEKSVNLELGNNTNGMENVQYNDYCRDRLQELEKENEQLKLIKSSLQNHLNFLMRKIRHIKLAESEDLVDEESIRRTGIRFSIADSNGLSSRCYTTLFDSMEDFSISQGADEFRLSGLDQDSESNSSDSYVDLNAYSPSVLSDHPPQVFISRKQILLSDTTESQSRSFDLYLSAAQSTEQPFFFPGDLKGSILSPEIVIKSPRRNTRSNRMRSRMKTFNSQPTSPDPVCRAFVNETVFRTMQLSETSSPTQMSPIDIFRSYHSSRDRDPLSVKLTADSVTVMNYSNPIADLLQFLPFYTCVRNLPRLAKISACSCLINNNLPSGSSSSFEIGENALNPFVIAPKSDPISPLEEPTAESNYSELPSKIVNNVECESVGSVEYCLPPEEESTFSGNQIESRQLNSMAIRNAQANKEKQILKKGIIRKLNKKFKLWGNFWCILTNKGLFFYSIKHQPQPEDFFFVQKPVKGISVEIMSRIELVKSDKESSEACLGSFDIITKNSKIYTLATGERTASLEWIRAIKNVLLQHQAYLIMLANSKQLLHKGWISRVKWGYSKRLWCCLAGKYLIYFNNKNDVFPTGYRDLSNSTIEINSSSFKVQQHNDSSSPSSEISDSHDYPDVYYTISLSQNNCTPIFICLQTESEFRTWLHYLKISIQNVSSDNAEPTKSPNFNLIIRPEYVNQFYFTTMDINEPVSLTTSPHLKTGAVQLWKALQRLTLVDHYSVRKDHLREKYERISFITQLCYREPGLKDELYLQLIKQTQLNNPKESKSQQKKIKFSILCGSDSFVSSNSSVHDGFAKTLTGKKSDDNAILAMWECLAIFIPIFLPSPNVLLALKQYLAVIRELKPINEIYNYASFCFDQLNQVKESSGRSTPPSYFEINAISTRNPYTHSLPFSLPVYMEFGSYQVMSFSPLSSVQMLHDCMLQVLFSPELLLFLKDICLFAIYLYQPSSATKFVYLNPNIKICDAISKFEDELKQNKQSGGSDGSDLTAIESSTEMIKFFFRIQAFRYSELLECYQKNPLYCLEIFKMLCHQIHNDVKTGQYSLSGSQLLVLITFMFDAYQVENTEISLSDRMLSQLVNDYFPITLIDATEKIQHIKSVMLSRINQGESTLDQSPTNLYFEYLQYLRDICDNQITSRFIPCIGAKNSDSLAGQQLIVVCQESSIMFLDYKCRVCLKKIPISDVLSFGSSESHQFLIAYSLLPTRKSFKRIILHFPDNCLTLELIQSIVFFCSHNKSQV